MALPRSPMKGVKYTLQDAQSTGNGLVAALSPAFRNHTIYIKGSTGVASGAVQIEGASAYDYSGTWGQIGGGPITVSATTELVINFSGEFRFIRVRISTTIGSGTVTVQYEGGL